MEITFLKSSFNIPLRKEYGGKNGDQAYPQVAKFDSKSIKITADKQGLIDFEKALNDYGDKGYAMLKGKASRQIKKARRRGLTEKTDPTQHIVIDIDGVELPNIDPTKGTNDQRQVLATAEKVIQLLPVELHTVSYIVGVSSGYGRKPTVNLHFHFLLDREYSPQAIGDWLCSLNFSIDDIKKQLSLTATKKFLKLIVDPTTARNGQLIYIAPPKFHAPAKDPVQKGARCFLVNKQLDTLHLQPLIERADPEVNDTLIEQTIKALCKEQNVRYKAPSYVSHPTHGPVVTNPGRMRVEFSYADDDFVRFNINNGDSNAYWVSRKNPQIMHSFKGDPPFDFKAANPEMYEWTVQNYGMMSDEPTPIVAHEPTRDIYIKAIYSPEGNLQEFYYSKKDSLKDWLASYGVAIPEIIEPWDVVFDPKSDTPAVDPKKKTINLYTESKYLRNAADMSKVKFKEDLEYGYGYQLEDVAPFSYRIIRHMLGGTPVTVEHFINWLAYCIQTKEKAKTAWLLHGRTGTGKGLFFNKILHPLIGGTNLHDFALLKRMGDLDDSFNGYMETCLFLMVDEFRMANSKALAAIENQLKNAITEPVGTIRGMRQNPVQRKLFTNFIFATNDNDALRLAADDRRYNVAERQNIKIKDAIPEIANPNFDEVLEAELVHLAGFLKAFNYDLEAVRTPIENNAKALMREASAPTNQLFLHHIEQGNLDPFCEILWELPSSPTEQVLHDRITFILKGWIADANHKKTYIQKAELKSLLEYAANRDLSRSEFSKILASANLTEMRKRVNGVQRPGFEVKFTVDEELRTSILKNLSAMELKTLEKDKRFSKLDAKKGII